MHTIQSFGLITYGDIPGSVQLEHKKPHRRPTHSHFMIHIQGAAKVRTFYSSSFRMPDVPGRSLPLLDTYLGTTRFFGWIRKEHLGTVNILQDRGTKIVNLGFKSKQSLNQE